VTLNTSFLEAIYITHAVVLPYVNQHTKYEVPSFTNSKDMFEGKM